MECAVCGKPGRKRRGIKRVLCDACAQAALNNEQYRRGDISDEFAPKPFGVKYTEGAYDHYERENRVNE